jgi:uncharacterized protein with PIN domain
MVTATFRFDDELAFFLPPARRRVDFVVPCARHATAKHMIEALGVPHTEVESIAINGKAAGFGQLLHDGDLVCVGAHPLPGSVAAVLRLRPWPLPLTRFVADCHLGGLARLLRMAGFDTLYRSDYGDREIATIALRDQRIVLTRDRELLKMREISHGCYVRALEPPRQLVEVLSRLDIAAAARPFSLCLECNLPLQAVPKIEVAERLPPSVRAGQQHFMHCVRCDRIYWQGSHFERMRRLLDDALAQALRSCPD